MHYDPPPLTVTDLKVNVTKEPSSKTIVRPFPEEP
jgi:hypothetical protein